ncbi:MAG: hypothetical protein RR543_02255 [Erysipelotrichales bacterium]
MKITNIELDKFYNDLCLEVLQLNKNDIIAEYEVDGEKIYLYRYEDDAIDSFKNCIIISEHDIDRGIDTFYKEYFFVKNNKQTFLNYQVRCKYKEAALHVAKQLSPLSIEDLAKAINHRIVLRADIYDIKLKLDF